MSQQPYPPQQPQPGWGAPRQGWGTPPPPPPKKRSVGKILGFGCLGIVALFVVIAIAGSGGSGKTSSSDSKPTTAASKDAKSAAAGKAKAKADGSKSDSKTVVFKVWGAAPAGALGPIDITYGSDSDNRKGTFKNGVFQTTLPVTKGAMYFNVNAQLQGSGDIHCSVTIGGKTKTGHASGGYNICDAQLSSGLLGGWE